MTTRSIFEATVSRVGNGEGKARESVYVLGQLNPITCSYLNYQAKLRAGMIHFGIRVAALKRK